MNVSKAEDAMPPLEVPRGTEKEKKKEESNCWSCGVSDRYCEIREPCVDCGHRACENCQVYVHRGNCKCNNAIYGAAYCDEETRIPDWGYRGPYKSIVQITMEKILAERGRSNQSCRMLAEGEKLERFTYCSSYISNGDHPKCMVLLADVREADKRFCHCGCVVYCSDACKGKDSYTVDYSRGLNYCGDEDFSEMVTHEDLCEPYLPPNEWTAVSVFLREYQAQFGHYPGPFFGHG